MKYLSYLLIFLCFLLSGCTKKLDLNINTNNITNIVYEDVELPNNEFDFIKDKINNSTFYDLYSFDINGKEITIYTNNNTYNFEILDDYLIYIDNENKYYTKIDNIGSHYKQIADNTKYTFKEN